MEVRRSVIALDDGDAVTGSQQSLQRDQGRDGTREVLEDEADEEVVEGLGVERQIEDVLVKGDAPRDGAACAPDAVPFSAQAGALAVRRPDVPPGLPLW
jgi:hypothetical protein